MKKIIGVLIISALVSCFGNDENGDNVLILSKRDRCENTVRNSIALAPRPCIVGLATLAGDVNFQTLNNLILIQCLNYQFEMKKCKSESDVLPP